MRWLSGVLSATTVDTALRTLAECPAWGEPGRDLVAAIGVGAVSRGCGCVVVIVAMLRIDSA